MSDVGPPGGDSGARPAASPADCFAAAVDYMTKKIHKSSYRKHEKPITKVYMSAESDQMGLCF